MTENINVKRAVKVAQGLREELVKRGLERSRHASRFWKDRLSDRENYPDADDLTMFRRGFAGSVGFTTKVKQAEEQARFEAGYERAVKILGRSRLRDLQERSTGLPYTFERDGVVSSVAGLNNAVSFGLIESALKRHGGQKPRTVLEIGAGYGGVAELALREWRPTNYVICDLPENLYLAAYFLAAEHPNLKTTFLFDDQASLNEADGLVFVVPEAIENISIRFDVVVNTYSFQEMEKAEVDRYFQFVSNALSPQGIFYSLNHFGASGVARPADYPFGLFDLQEWGPLPEPAANLWLRRQHIEAVMVPRTDKKALPAEFATLSYPIGLMLFAGLSAHLSGICRALIRGELSVEDKVTIATIGLALQERDPHEADVILRNLRAADDLRAAVSYIRGALLLVADRASDAGAAMKESIALGLDGLARVRALLVLSLQEDNSYLRWQSREDARAMLPQFISQIEEERYDLPKLASVFQFCFPALEQRRGQFLV